jgi:hypothetical protein
MNLNNFIDYAASKHIRVHGFEAHVQAHAILDTHTAGGAHTLLLILQGRATHVRALWAAFHEKNLITTGLVYPRDDGKTYVTPTPTIALPQGIQTWIIHRDLTPTHCSHTQGHFFTFGPPHFGAMLAATTAVPMLPHWEATVFEIGQRVGLIETLRRCYNTRIYTVSRSAEEWLTALQTNRKELPNG